MFRSWEWLWCWTGYNEQSSTWHCRLQNQIHNETIKLPNVSLKRKDDAW